LACLLVFFGRRKRLTFNVIGDLGDSLHRAVVSDDLVSQGIVPQSSFGQFFKKVRVDDLEFSCENPAGVNVGCVGLDANDGMNINSDSI